ncbi:MAG TPA: DUF475 domain-containing protein [Verrucomicrobiae bacterium]|nr:DUF475 domain-containing protein [Verrucomicrobiae bacterium]
MTVTILLTILGLIIFEVVTSVDNAVINAEVLSTMGERARRWFLTWGILFAVFVVRGALPWLIIWVVNPSLGPMGALFATFSNDPAVHESIERSAPVLLAAGGTFMIFLFFYWLFLEEKNFGLPRAERFFMRFGIWFYAVVAILLSTIVWFALKQNPVMAFGAVIGSTAFFITHGFKENAEKGEQDLLKKDGKMSDISKIFYLEIIDTSFSIDGVLGAFAFTLSVPIILLGNGIGAIVIREITVRNLRQVKRYLYLKNGAMYSVAVLGTVMVLNAFGLHTPHWLAPLATVCVVGYFFLKSSRELKGARA